MVSRNPSIGVQLAQRDVECPLIRFHLPQAIERQINAFSDADSCGAREQERIRSQVIGSAQFLLQELVLLQRKGFGKIAGRRRKVLRTNEVWRNGVAVGGQIL